MEGLAEEAAGERIGIIGGTFDPVHYAHLAIAEEVYSAIKLARVIFVPAGQPPHKLGNGITPVRQRLAMLELALATNVHFTLSLVDVQRSGPSYTVDTLRLLRHELGPHAELYFVIGGDSLEDLPDWYDPAGILAQATIVALRRPGYAEVSEQRARLEARLPGLKHRLITLEGPRMDIASTDLRRRVAEERPIKYQVPEAVEEYILLQGLYRSADQRLAATQEKSHMSLMEFELGDRLRLRKPHPCGSYEWLVIRLGADIGLRCVQCGRRVLLPRPEVERRTRAIVSHASDPGIPAPSSEQEKQRGRTFN